MRPRINVEGTTVHVRGARMIRGTGIALHFFVLKISRIPIGLDFRDCGAGWGMLDLIPWTSVPSSMRVMKEET